MGTTDSLTSSSYDNFFEFPSWLLTNDSTAYHKLFFASYQSNGVFFLLIFSPMHVNIIHVQLYRSFSVTWSAAFQIAWNKRSFNIWKEFNSHRIFLYTNMAADPLFCTQIWPPWRHVKTIYYDTELYSTFRRPKRWNYPSTWYILKCSVYLLKAELSAVFLQIILQCKYKTVVLFLVRSHYYSW